MQHMLAYEFLNFTGSSDFKICISGPTQTGGHMGTLNDMVKTKRAFYFPNLISSKKKYPKYPNLLDKISNLPIFTNRVCNCFFTFYRQCC